MIEIVTACNQNTVSIVELAVVARGRMLIHNVGHKAGEYKQELIRRWDNERERFTTTSYM